MDYWDGDSMHEVCIPYMATARVKQEEETDKSNSKKFVRNLEERNAEKKDKSPKQGLISSPKDANLPTIHLFD